MRQICAGRRPLRRQAGHADRHHRRRPGAEGRHQSRARRVDHRETAYSSARVPRDLQIHRRARTGPDRDRRRKPQVKLSGLVTGTPGGVQTNRPVADASVEVYRVSRRTPANASAAPSTPRRPAPTDAGARPQVDPAWYLEIVLTSAGSTTTHFYRSPFPRSSDIVHLRAARPLGPADAGAGAVVLMSRPRGYFGLPRDVVLFDGKEPADVKPGVPTDAISDAAASGRGDRPSGGGAVQPGADRGARLAGVGKPDCGRRADLLACGGLGRRCLHGARIWRLDL